MKWFAHHHRWLPKTDLNTIRDPKRALPSGALLLETCHCGAVRTIEFAPGSAPVVRVAKQGSECAA